MAAGHWPTAPGLHRTTTTPAHLDLRRRGQPRRHLAGDGAPPCLEWGWVGGHRRAQVNTVAAAIAPKVAAAMATATATVAAGSAPTTAVRTVAATLLKLAFAVCLRTSLTTSVFPSSTKVASPAATTEQIAARGKAVEKKAMYLSK